MSYDDALMSKAGLRVRVVDDHMFEIRHRPDGPRRGSCRLQLFTAAGLRPVAVATWVRGDGCSLTNCAEQFATEAWRRHCPQDAEPPIWIERQTLGSDPNDETWQKVVIFTVAGRFELSSPKWYGISNEELTKLVGNKVDPSRGEGFRPLPEPVFRVQYRTRWVATLPNPRPLNDPDCMTEPGPNLVRRLGQQLVPRRTPSDCCWYHEGDWAKVSRTAIRLVREAVANDVPEDEIYEVVQDRAETEGVNGWDLAALDSLVNPYAGIFVARRPFHAEHGRTRTHSFYVNGRHRVQAMLGAGVRRTLVVTYWEEEPT